MSEIISKRSPLYESLPTIYDHHAQLWAGTPARFKAVWEQKMGGTALYQYFAM